MTSNSLTSRAELKIAVRQSSISARAFQVTTIAVTDADVRASAPVNEGLLRTDAGLHRPQVATVGSDHVDVGLTGRSNADEHDVAAVRRPDRPQHDSFTAGDRLRIARLDL